MTVRISKEAILKAIKGKTSLHPIEEAMPEELRNRFEVMDFGIFDHDTGIVFPQNQCYLYFCSEFSALQSRPNDYNLEDAISMMAGLYGVIELSLS